MADLTPRQWAAGVLSALGIHQTPGGVQALTGWAQAEGGHWNNDARYNPLNTTQPEPGAGNTGTQGNIKQYRSWQQGIDATVKTLRNGRYGGILSALQSGDPAAVASAIGKTPWGTAGDLVQRTIMSTPRVAGVHAPAGVAADPGARAAGVTESTSPRQITAGDPGAAQRLIDALAPQAPRPSAGLATPAFAAAPALPTGYQTPVSAGGGQARGAEVDALLAAAAQSQGQGLNTGGDTTVTSSAGPAASSAGVSGRVKVAAGANRPGVGLSPGIMKVVERVAGAAGKPLTIGTGTNHSEMTSSGNVSDHWSGNGADIPAKGAELTQLGAAALQALGGYSPAEAARMAKQGGIFNLPYGKHRRIQVIVNAADHFDHLHVGVTANGAR